MRNLRRMFRPLKDPRASNAQHSLVDILVIALAATLAGAKTCTEFEFFGKGREELLRRFLELSPGIPSHDTFSNVFRALDPKGLEAVLRKFSKGLGVKGRGQHRRQSAARSLYAGPAGHAAAYGQCLGGRHAHGVGSEEGPQSQRGCRRSRSPRPARSGRHPCHRRRLALPPRHGAGHSRPEGPLRVGHQEQSRPALQGRHGAARCRPTACAGEPAKELRSWPHRAPAGHRRARTTVGTAIRLPRYRRRPHRQLARQCRQGRQAQGPILPGLVPAVGQEAARGRARPLGHREQPALGPRYGVRRRCLPPARITRRKTSPSSASSPSTSCRQRQDLLASATKCSRPDGTTTSFSAPSPICDSPTCGSAARWN